MTGLGDDHHRAHVSCAAKNGFAAPGNARERPGNLTSYGKLLLAHEIRALSAGPPPYSLSPMVEPVGC